MRGILDRLFPKCLLVELVPPVTDAVLFIEIPTTKDSIAAGPFISDSKSTATVSREAVEAFIRDACKDFPMDYGSVGPGPTVQAVIRVEAKGSLRNTIRAEACDPTANTRPRLRNSRPVAGSRSSVART